VCVCVCVCETRTLKDGRFRKQLFLHILCRIEKEIEALEREEMNISTNEGLILKRLKAIEKSPEDIIKVQCFCYDSFKTINVSFALTISNKNRKNLYTSEN